MRRKGYKQENSVGEHDRGKYKCMMREVYVRSIDCPYGYVTNGLQKEHYADYASLHSTHMMLIM